MSLNDKPAFRPLTGIFEPSDILQLPDGRFLVVEDEKQQPLSLITMTPAGETDSVALQPGAENVDDDFWKLNDLEGVALDRSGFIYAITSHSRNAAGDEKKSREKLLRFRIEGAHALTPQLCQELKPALIAAHPALAEAAAIRDVKSGSGFNIEGLTISPDKQQLLIGFRSPLLDARAIIARVENPAALFDAGERPHISADLDTLDLDGDGIRGMAYIPALSGYLVISGPVAREQLHFRLWFWRGRRDNKTRRVTAHGLSGFEHAEGISPALIGGRQCVIIVSDDGSRAAGRYGRYLVLELGELRIDD